MKRLNVYFLLPGLLVLFTMWGQAARAELPQPLGKDAAVEYALAHNRAYRAVFEDVSVSGEKVNQALADFFPKVDASYAFTRLNEQPFVTLTIPNSATFSNIPFSIQTINRWEVDLVQPLFTGFGLESQYKASKVGLKISKYQLEQARLDLTRDVQVAYLQTLLGTKLLEVAHENTASLEVQKKNAEAGYQQGVAAKNDVLKADVALAEAVQRERNSFKQLVILRSNLNQLMDVDLQEKVDLSGIQEQIYKVPDLYQLYTAAEEKRPEYLAVQESIRQAQYSKTAARSRYYPHVSAFAQFYREGEDFSGDNNPYTNNENASVGVRVDWNLFEGGKTRSSELEWEYRLRGIEKRKEDLLQKIQLQVKNALEQLKVAEANIETARVSVEQAEENDRITTLQYKEQIAIFLEVLNAQVFLAQTRADFNQALYGYEIARAELERAIGGPIENSQQ
ncbi:Outer membrane efflux protein [Syntrophobacter sp. SbD1]|nr:Outer membrane efflux protein [Syntrophobacter sp. SbD1]